MEVYAAPDPHANAYTYGEEQGRILVVMTSALIEGLTSDELRFVIGHELGHAIFGHLDIPVGLLARGDTGIGKEQALRLFSWQRHAEISADRAGLVCAKSLEPTASAFFKISSGLTGTTLKFDIDEYLAQIGDIEAEAASSETDAKKLRADWFASHPFSPLRLRVAQLTARSQILTEDGMPITELEQEIQSLMTIMDPGYVHDRSDTGEGMRRLLFSGGLLIATADGDMHENEIKVFERFLGEGAMPTDPKPAAIRANLDSIIEHAQAHVPPARIAQVVRDLTVIAVADGRVSAAELEVLEDLAARLQLDSELVARSLEAAHRRLD